MQAAPLSWLLLLQGSAAELQKVQGPVALDPTRLSAALLALLAVPVVAWSEYILKATGQHLTCIVVVVLASHFDPGWAQPEMSCFRTWDIFINLHAANLLACVSRLRSAEPMCCSLVDTRTSCAAHGDSVPLPTASSGVRCSAQSSFCKVSRLALSAMQGVGCRQGQVGCWGPLRASPTLWWLDWFSGLSGLG